jgi:hypothetical protein
VPAQLVERAAHRCVRLHQRPLQLRRELRAVQLGEQRVDLRCGAAGLQVDDVELLLDAEQRHVTHGADAATRM